VVRFAICDFLNACLSNKWLSPAADFQSHSDKEKYFFTSLDSKNDHKTIPNTTVIYCHILNPEKAVTIVKLQGIFIIFMPGVIVI